MIAGKILEMENPALTGQKLGLYAMTVVTGLAIHALCVLPLLFLILTRKNPFPFIRGIFQALLIALATSSRYRARQEQPAGAGGGGSNGLWGSLWCPLLPTGRGGHKAARLKDPAA